MHLSIKYLLLFTTIACAAGTAVISIDEDPVGITNSGGVLRNVSVNEIFHQRVLANPQAESVVKPNVDTLYSRVVLDLSEDNVVLTVPKFNDSRYWVFPVYDPFGNNQAEIGVVNGNRPGDYLIRRAEDAGDTPGHSNDTSTFNSSAYEGVVNLPGSYGTMLIRILLLLHNTTEDLNAIHTYQNASDIRPIRRENASPRAPSLQSLALNGSFLGIDTPSKQLEFAARLTNYSQAEVYSQRDRISRILSGAGLSGGNYSEPSGVNLTEAAAIANASITADVEAPANIRDEGNGWQSSVEAFQGNFSTHYAAAAYVALAGYQQQSVRQTLYPGYGSRGFTSVFNLEPNTSTLVTFSGKPQLQSPGFWSLSVYGPDQYLIPNDINRFEVGDRTFNLTYDDGEPIYGPNANSSRDGPFQILVQPADQQPPANWTNNWLPAAEKFTWILRWYVPSPAMTNGSYEYPRVQNISAILAAVSGSSPTSGSVSTGVATSTSAAVDGTGGTSAGVSGPTGGSSSSTAAAAPLQTGAVGIAAMFGAGAALVNF